MPHKAKTHPEMQNSVCLLCFRKPKTLRNISPMVDSLLKTVIPLLCNTEEWTWLPTKICGGCFFELHKVKKDPRHAVKHIDYESLVPPQVKHSMQTRSRLQEEEESSALECCCCSVCSVGRLAGGEYLRHKAAVYDPPGRPKVKDSPVKSGPVTICSVCGCNYGPGYNHVCNRKTKRENLEELLRNTSQKSKERVISAQLKEVFHDQGVTTKGGTVSLSTGGAPILASLGKTKQKPPPKFSNETMNRLQNSIGASDKKMNIIGNFLRIGCGRPSVVKLQQQMTERNKKLADEFETKMLKQKKYVVDGEDKENEKGAKKKKKKIVVDVEKPAVLVKNVENFAALVMKERNLTPETSEIQIGIDDGQDLVKIMMTIKEKEKPEAAKNKKVKYKEGFGVKDFKLSGVKKLLILFVSPTCERYDNIATIMKELDLGALEFGFSCDLKLVLILCGKQCASSKHCCPFCIGSSPWLTKVTPSTIGSLWSSYNSYVENGSNLKQAQKYNNVVNPPLLTGSDNTKVLSIVYFPELHVLTGIVGKLVKELERKVFSTPEIGKKFMDDWMASPSVNVSRTVYQGSANFVGDMAKLLLKKIDYLEMAISKLDSVIVDKAASFINAFKQFEAVRKACFGQYVEQGYAERIKEFSVTYRSLGISIPLKVIHLLSQPNATMANTKTTPNYVFFYLFHICIINFLYQVHVLESHLEEFLEMKGGVYGAGYWSEQAPESCHKDFNTEWEPNKVGEKHPEYGNKLKTTVVRYDGKHL